MSDIEREAAMKLGKTEAETLALNGWKVGDILEGDEGNGPDRILITAIGEECFTCKWDDKATGTYGRESGNTTLRCRNWRKVGHGAGQAVRTQRPEPVAFAVYWGDGNVEFYESPLPAFGDEPEAVTPLYTHPHNGEQGGASETDRDDLLWAVYDHVAERFDFNKDPVLDIIGYLVDAGIVTKPPTEREGE